MSSTTERLARSPHKLERNLFELIWNLTEKQPWLKLKQSALIALIDECSDKDQQTLIFELLDRFKFVDGDGYSDAIKLIGEHIIKDLALVSERTAIAAREVSAFSDSSQMVVYHLKAFGGLPADWTTNRFVAGLKDVASLEIDDVVLVDEFLGSGESMEKSVLYVRGLGDKDGRKFRIHCAVIAGMEFGLERLKACADSVYAVHTLKKGISEAYPAETVPGKVALMEQIEGGLSKTSSRGKLSKHSLGYKKSEALYSRYEGNTPNNVFPVFWWEKNLAEIERERLLICR